MSGITRSQVSDAKFARTSDAVAVSGRETRGMRVSAGISCCVARLDLGVTASILVPFRSRSELRRLLDVSDTGYAGRA